MKRVFVCISLLLAVETEVASVVEKSLKADVEPGSFERSTCKNQSIPMCKESARQVGTQTGAENQSTFTQLPRIDVAGVC